jgi:hypothetical protein
MERIDFAKMTMKTKAEAAGALGRGAIFALAAPATERSEPGVLADWGLAAPRGVRHPH